MATNSWVMSFLTIHAVSKRRTWLSRIDVRCKGSEYWHPAPKKTCCFINIRNQSRKRDLPRSGAIPSHPRGMGHLSGTRYFVPLELQMGRFVVSKRDISRYNYAIRG